MLLESRHCTAPNNVPGSDGAAHFDKTFLHNDSLHCSRPTHRLTAGCSFQMTVQSSSKHSAQGPADRPGSSLRACAEYMTKIRTCSLDTLSATHSATGAPRSSRSAQPAAQGASIVARPGLNTRPTPIIPQTSIVGIHDIFFPVGLLWSII